MDKHIVLPQQIEKDRETRLIMNWKRQGVSLNWPRNVGHDGDQYALFDPFSRQELSHGFDTSYARPESRVQKKLHPLRRESLAACGRDTQLKYVVFNFEIASLHPKCWTARGAS